jgi:hypothetical protein
VLQAYQVLYCTGLCSALRSPQLLSSACRTLTEQYPCNMRISGTLRGYDTRHAEAWQLLPSNAPMWYMRERAGAPAHTRASACAREYQVSRDHVVICVITQRSVPLDGS